MKTNLTPENILKDLVTFKTIVGNETEFTKIWKYIDEIIQTNINWNYREYTSNGFTSRVYSHQNNIDNDEKRTAAIRATSATDATPFVSDKLSVNVFVKGCSHELHRTRCSPDQRGSRSPDRVG